MARVKQELIELVGDETDQAIPNLASKDSAPYQAMDFADDDQILSEIQGKGAEIADEWIYTFRSGGKEVTGLSWMGTKNAIYYFRRKKMADLYITDMEFIEDPTDKEYMLFKARCEDKINGGGIWGVKRQWTKMKLRDGSVVVDPFWYEKGTSKAQRNAMQAMMPADWITKLIKEWTDKGKTKALKGEEKEPEWMTAGDEELEKKMKTMRKANPTCRTCHGLTDYKQGVKNGRKWAGYFCTEDSNHAPQWIDLRKKQG